MKSSNEEAPISIEVKLLPASSSMEPPPPPLSDQRPSNNPAEEAEERCAHLAEQLLLIHRQSRLEEELAQSRERVRTAVTMRGSNAHSSTTVNLWPASTRADARSRHSGPFGINRLNLISFLNNIATPSTPSNRQVAASARHKFEKAQSNKMRHRSASTTLPQGFNTSRVATAQQPFNSREHPSPRSIEISVEVEKHDQSSLHTGPLSKSSLSGDNVGATSTEQEAHMRLKRKSIEGSVTVKASLKDLPSASVENVSNAHAGLAGLYYTRSDKASMASSTLSTSSNGNNSTSNEGERGKQQKHRECPICTHCLPSTNFPMLTNCGHRSCRSCLITYLHIEIMESRILVTCPECQELISVSDIYSLLAGDFPALLDRYENFALRRTLSLDPDTRWCPSPDCPYAVIANSCAACPQLRCERPGCGAQFCYHCKGFWHNNQTCDQARQGYIRELLEAVNQRRGGNSSDLDVLGDSGTGVPDSGPSGSGRSARQRLRRDLLSGTTDVMKACPRCGALIVKMNDGSCNHMVCALCGVEFCWLCRKQINELHYLSPTGCTFWGKKPWTRKKKLLWQIGTLIGAPIGIALIAGLAVPGIICGVPIVVGRKTYQRFSQLSRTKRHLITAVSVIGSLIVSPVLAVVAVGVGVPIMLAYVYGVVPLSLCRDGGCGKGNSADETNGPDPAYGEEESTDLLFLTLEGADAQERSRLLHRVQDMIHRGGDGGRDAKAVVETVATLGSRVGSEEGGHTGRRGSGRTTIGLIKKQSNNMSNDASSASSAGRRCHNRRQSTESGINSLGEKLNTEDASVRAIAGSQYNYDDSRSVHTIWSNGIGAHALGEVASYNEDAASTMACGGSVLESRSLAESGSCTLGHLSSNSAAAVAAAYGSNLQSSSSRGVMVMERDVSPCSNVRFASTPIPAPSKPSVSQELFGEEGGRTASATNHSHQSGIGSDTARQGQHIDTEVESDPIVVAGKRKQRPRIATLRSFRSLLRRPLTALFSISSTSPSSTSAAVPSSI